MILADPSKALIHLLYFFLFSFFSSFRTVYDFIPLVSERSIHLSTTFHCRLCTVAVSYGLLSTEKKNVKSVGTLIIGTSLWIEFFFLFLFFVI